MNPEAGFIEPFRSRVVRVAKVHPALTADEIIRIARGQAPAIQPPAPTQSTIETPLELLF